MSELTVSTSINNTTAAGSVKSWCGNSCKGRDKTRISATPRSVIARGSMTKRSPISSPLDWKNQILNQKTQISISLKFHFRKWQQRLPRQHIRTYPWTMDLTILHLGCFRPIRPTSSKLSRFVQPVARRNCKNLEYQDEGIQKKIGWPKVPGKNQKYVSFFVLTVRRG